MDGPASVPATAPVPAPLSGSGFFPRAREAAEIRAFDRPEDPATALLSMPAVVSDRAARSMIDPRRGSPKEAIATIFRKKTSKIPPWDGTIQDRLRYALEESLAEERMTFADLRPFRIKTAYRLVRYLVTLLQVGAPDEPLVIVMANATADLPEITPKDARKGIAAEDYRAASAWLQLRAPGFYFRNGSRAYMAPVARTARFARSLNVQLPILPPPPRPPSQWPIFEEYNPTRHEPDLVTYCRILDSLADDLDILDGTETNPQEGRWGMAGLTDPWTVRLAFPTGDDLILYEEAMTNAVLRKMVKGNTRSAVVYLQKEHGFSEVEADNMISLSRRTSIHKTSNDEGTNRSMLVLRLEDMLHRAKKYGNFRAEGEALKQLALVQGLGTNKTDDILATFLETAKQYTRQASAPGQSTRIVEGTVVNGQYKALPNSDPARHIPGHIKIPPPPETPGADLK